MPQAGTTPAKSPSKQGLTDAQFLALGGQIPGLTDEQFLQMGGKPAALDIKPEAAKQAAPAPEADMRTPGQVALDQLYSVAKGVPQAVTGIYEGFKNITNARALVEGIPGILQPYATAAKGAVALGSQLPGIQRRPFEYLTQKLGTPSRQEFEQAAEGAGAQAGGLALGEGLVRGVPAVVNKVVSRPFFQPTVVKPAVPAKVIREAVPEKLVKPFEPGRIIEQAKPEIPPDAPKVNKWMGVASKELEYGSNPGQRLLDEGLIGADKTATQANVNSRLGTVGNSLESELVKAGDAGATVDVQTPVYDAAAKVKKLIGKKTDKAFQAAVDQVVDDIESEAGNLADASPLTAHSIKKAVGKSIDWHSTATDPINEMKIEIYRNLNKAIKEAAPQVADIQDIWSDLYIASKSLRKAIAKDLAGTGTGALLPEASTPAKIAAGQKPVVKPGKPAVIKPEQPAKLGPSPASKLAKKTLPFAIGTGLGATVLREFLTPKQ